MPSEALELGHLATPKEGTHPGVVMIHDVWGLANHTRALAGRLCREGFSVLAIDLYRKTGQPILTDVESAMAWIRELSDPVVMETLQEGIDFLAVHPSVGGQKVGLTGFCMGGQYTLLGACTCRGLAAAVAFYGMLRYEPGLDPAKKPRSALEALPDLSCPLLGLFGAEDAIIPVEDVNELERRLPATGHPFDVKLYEGAGHAFMNDTRPEMYRPKVAEDAWGRMVRFFAKNLG